MKAFLRFSAGFVVAFILVFYARGHRNSSTDGQVSVAAPAVAEGEETRDAQLGAPVAASRTTQSQEPHKERLATAVHAVIDAKAASATGQPVQGDIAAAHPPLRKSQLHEWRQFVTKNPRVGHAAEAIVTEAIGYEKIIDTYNACGAPAASNTGVVDPLQPPPGEKFHASGMITIEGQEATVEGWGCEFEGTASPRDRAICECVASRLPSPVTVQMKFLREEDQTSFEGGFYLPL